MPGFTLIVQSTPEPLPAATWFPAMDAVCHNPDYVREVFLDEAGLFLGCTRYPQYPIRFFETERYRVCFEGRAYNQDERGLTERLAVLCEDAFDSGASARTRCARWLREVDGDYVIIIIDKRSRAIAVMNDSLARLPVYYCATNGRVVVSREFRLIAEVAPARTFDRLAVAEVLMLCYPLLDRTLLKGVSRLRPGTLLLLPAEGGLPQVSTLYSWDFEGKAHAGKPISENADALAELFKAACSRQGKTDHAGVNLLALSGGLDSRAVACGFVRTGTPLVTSTYGSEKYGAADARVARQIAHALRLEWHEVALSPTNGQDALELLRLKAGLNFLTMSFYVPFLRHNWREFGSSTAYFTGDGGDKVFPDMRSPAHLHSVPEIVDYMVACKLSAPLSSIAEITGVPRQDLVADLTQCLAQCPEQSPTHKYVHFLVYERGSKWLFEGEDRNRCYFWSTTPFYSREFFEYAMNCPDRQKIGYRLYMAFLHRLAPEVCGLVDASFGVPADSFRCRAKRRILDAVAARPWLQRRVKRLVLPAYGIHAPGGAVLECLKRQLGCCPAIADCLQIPVLEQRLATRPGISRVELNNLFTIVSSLEIIVSGRSSLDSMLSREFDW